MFVDLDVVQGMDPMCAHNLWATVGARSHDKLRSENQAETVEKIRKLDVRKTAQTGQKYTW